jgi:histidine triad (HIT) family protein
MDTSETCTFCNQEKVKTQIVYVDSLWRIIFARRPLAVGHIMIMPIKHFSSFTELGLEELATIGAIIKKATQALEHAFQATGVNVFANIGKAAGQSIPHLHIHIITRFDNELTNPFHVLNTSEGTKKLLRPTKEAIDERIRALQAFLV